MKKVALYLGIFLFSVLNNLWIFHADNLQAIRILSMSCFGGMYIVKGTVMEFTLKSVPLLFFQILETSICHEEFTMAGIYVFTRCPNRRKQATITVFRVILGSIVYSLIWQGTGLVMGMIVGMDTGGYDFLSVFIPQILLLAGWMAFFTVGGFWVCIFHGSMAGVLAGLLPHFLLISSMQLFASGSVLSVDIDDPGFAQSHLDIFKLHPFSQLVLDWHSSTNAAFSAYMNYYPMNFSFWPGVCVFWLLLSAVSIVLILSVNNMEFYSVKS